MIHDFFFLVAGGETAMRLHQFPYRSGEDVVRVHRSVFSGCVLECPGVTENLRGLCSLLFLNGGVDGIDDFFPWNQDFADVFFHLGNEVGLRGVA